MPGVQNNHIQDVRARHSRHSSGNWTARCRPTNETKPQSRIVTHVTQRSRERDESNGASTGR